MMHVFPGNPDSGQQCFGFYPGVYEVWTSATW
jgi:hypothetical protein